MNDPRNVWYVAATETELSDQPLRRVVLSTPVGQYRATDGTPVALQDRCPHGFAPLSRRRVDGDRIISGYHGLAFARDGRCVHNPHGEVVVRPASDDHP